MRLTIERKRLLKLNEIIDITGFKKIVEILNMSSLTHVTVGNLRKAVRDNYWNHLGTNIAEFILQNREIQKEIDKKEEYKDSENLMKKVYELGVTRFSNVSKISRDEIYQYRMGQRKLRINRAKYFIKILEKINGLQN